MLKSLLTSLLTSLLAACLLAAAPARAADPDVKKAVEARLGGKVDSVTKTPYLGLYEVYTNGEILYVDEKVTVLIAGGNLIDAKTMKSVTQERLNKLSAIQFSDLPLDLAIKQVKGNGKRILATFEDPNCGFCRRLARELTQVDNVTIYTFLLPILSPDSIDKAKAIWCADDRAKTWNALMQQGQMPAAAKAGCNAPVEKWAELGRKFNINGTPTLFFANGERYSGYLPAAQLTQKLDLTAR